MGGGHTQGGGGVLDGIRGAEAGQVPAEGSLLGPIGGGGLEEAAATQVEERHQVLHHAHAVETERRKGLRPEP